MSSSLIIIIFFGIRNTVAKYKSTEEINKTIKIAQPIFKVDGNEKTKINSINNIGYYEFSIRNYNETDVSETGFLYNIEIISKTDESIEFQLYKNEQEIKLENLKTEEFSIPGNKKIEQKYKLKVKYDETKGTIGKDILEEIQIKIHSEQAKIG